MQNLGKNLLILFLVGAIAVSFVFGLSIGKNQALVVPIEGATNLEAGKPALVDFSLFWEAWSKVTEKFAKRDSLDYQDMVHGAISGMVESLGDVYTVFMDPEEAKKFQDDISGFFEGVGMEIGIREKQLQVIAPLEGTPAKTAGLRPGDKILRIDDISTDGMSVERAVTLIRGPRGTKVKLSIFREGWDEPKDFEIQRAVISVASLKWEMKEGNIAVIKIFQFSEKAGRDFGKAASEIRAQGAQKIVLDVRGNPGGFLQVAEDIAGFFLKSGQTVVIEDFGSGSEQVKHETEGSAVFSETPMVVLINEGSASASEILAGALRDNRGIQLIGKKSFGKGSVQELEQLRDNSFLKVTVANWLTPNGSFITDKGLEPDTEVEFTEEDFESEKDPQLDKALEIVKKL
ncbi:MAG: S41 family peptidase [Candidatus Wildermuthbacteria bacterium]|nr:S41 family peptidase [Candidatus Wildermuthbacteria bacterium]